MSQIKPGYMGVEIYVCNNNFKLDMNCDISSNNTIWARFMSFCGGHFEFRWVIFIMTD